MTFGSTVLLFVITWIGMAVGGGILLLALSSVYKRGKRLSRVVSMQANQLAMVTSSVASVVAARERESSGGTPSSSDPEKSLEQKIAAVSVDMDTALKNEDYEMAEGMKIIKGALEKRLQALREAEGD